jgi:hypothetical protein
MIGGPHVEASGGLRAMGAMGLPSLQTSEATGQAPNPQSELAGTLPSWMDPDLLVGRSRSRRSSRARERLVTYDGLADIARWERGGRKATEGAVRPPSRGSPRRCQRVVLRSVG